MQTLRTRKCGEEELVRQVHTLFVRSAQQVAVYDLQVQEGVEGVEGVRQEVREVEGGARRGETLTCTCRKCERLITWAPVRVRVTLYTQEETEQCALTLRQCGSQWKWSCCHWCTHRAMSPRIHGQCPLLVPTSTRNLFPVPTCSQAVWDDRHFYPVAILCTLLHRENTSLEVLYLDPRCCI